MMSAKSVRAKDVQGVFWADRFFKEITCVICRRKKRSSWIRITEEELEPVCEDCREKISGRTEEEETKFC